MSPEAKKQFKETLTVMIADIRQKYAGQKSSVTEKARSDKANLSESAKQKKGEIDKQYNDAVNKLYDNIKGGKR